ncbi:Aldehyde:ferredoxin oxidoreductase [Archaeoglobus sulfaticallidus PM70-1]|uniref:Aldehyde:ferredoxin oxidoreductase n=1 Tax=Archaeoglobus sulfaticallidus PM70-1 TaxID=387631 RepID=N0BP59_9EURY|nr:aldehyde ferredoxin oxidoreductase family protein [Archaeoglobus sulfaticallidus]AGK62135.1 Aldehyde:ferredoxin oxidoreductase [Archaeoglobus sulfaticallidus PM70-1]
MFAYAGRILKVNLEKGSAEVMDLDEDVAKNYIGGSGFGAYFLYRMKVYDAEPFSDSNVLGIFNGPLSGTIAPSTSRLEFCAKSPLTGIWGESNSGGKFSAFLKFAGWDGIIIEGKSEKPVYLLINPDTAEIRSADGIWGLGCYDSQKEIEKEVGESRISTAVIGQAGENLVRYACVQLDNSRHAGRTGMGAVMGSKKLKGIAVVYDKMEIELADEERFKEEVSALNERIDNNFTCNMFREIGTSGYVETSEMFGDLPVKYFTQGTFEKASDISGTKMAEEYLKRSDGCFGCRVRCGTVVEIDGRSIHGPEYETIASFGSLQLVDDLKSLIEINYLANDFGLDTISAGVTIAFAMFLTDNGVYDFSIRWGDAEGVKKLIEEIAFRKNRGEILAEGTRFIGNKFSVENLAANVKGLEIPMHDPRAFASLAAAYAMHNRGACHLPHQMYNIEMGLKVKEYGIVSDDRFSSENKGVITARMQNYTELYNCVTMCAFMPVKPAQMANLLKYSTGFDFDVNSIYLAGERIYNLKRMFNVKCGITARDDTLPEIVMKPLEGGSEGNVPDFELQKKEYYIERGWDDNGVPKPEKLKALGLDWVLN